MQQKGTKEAVTLVSLNPRIPAGRNKWDRKTLIKTFPSLISRCQQTKTNTLSVCFNGTKVLYKLLYKANLYPSLASQVQR